MKDFHVYDIFALHEIAVLVLQGPKPTLKNREVINMDKIPEHLPRKILENYSWMQSDDDMHVHVILPIEEPVDRNCVMARFRYMQLHVCIRIKYAILYDR